MSKTLEKRPVNKRSRRRKKRRTEDFSSSSEDSDSSASSNEDEDQEGNGSAQQREETVAETENGYSQQQQQQQQLQQQQQQRLQQTISSISGHREPKNRNISLHNVIEESEQSQQQQNQKSTISNELRAKLNMINAQSNRNANINKAANFNSLSHSIAKSEQFLHEFAKSNLPLTNDKKQKEVSAAENKDNGNVNNSTKEKKNKLLDEYLSLMMSDYDADLDVLRTASDLNEFSLPILATLLKEGGNIFDYESLNTIVNYR